MTYLKIGEQLYSATFEGRVRDDNWGGRESKTVRLEITHDAALALFVGGLQWSIVEQDGEDAEEWDNSDYSVAGSITDNRDGTCSCKMGKKTAIDILAELEAAYDGE